MNTFEMASLVVRLGLAAVLGRAALAKLVDRDAAREGARQLGVPAAMVAAVGIGLPLAELAVAIGLATTPAAGGASLAAVVLLAAFTVLIGVNLAAGRHPACNCFGADAAPIGVATLVRNVALTAAAGLLAGRSIAGASLGSYRELTTDQAWILAGAGAVVALAALTAWVLVNLVRQNARLLERIEALEALASGAPAARRQRSKGLPPGTPAPPIAAVDTAGQTLALGDLLDGRPLVLVFVEPGCGACVALGDELALRREPFTDRRVVVIASATMEATAAKFGAITAADVLADPTGEVSRAYGVVGTPSAVVVTPDGRIARPLAEGRFDSRRLLGDQASELSAELVEA